MSGGYDDIVVGAGAAGCVLAARLAQADRKVLLLEAGGSDRGLLTRVPLLTVFASASARRNWAFETEPIPALNGRRQVWNQGRLLGGSSSINGMIYMRGHPAEYDAWGCEGWRGADLLPLFRRSEANVRGEGPWHGASGPMQVRPARSDLPICDDFLAAVRAQGHPIVDDLNAGVSEGFGAYDCNIGGGVRSSASRAFLRGRGRRGPQVMTGAVAARVLIEAGRARGVEVRVGGERRRIEGDRVILCAGALNTPALLMRSGVGPAGELRRLGLAVAADSPEVGANLRNHPAHFDQYLCHAPVTAYRYLSPTAGARAVLDYALAGAGPLAESITGIGGFMRSDPSAPFADTIVVLVPSLLRRANGAAAWLGLLPRRHGFTVATALGRTFSSGRVRLRSTDPVDAPLIEPGFFGDPRDMAALVRSVARMRAAMRQPCIARHIEGPPLSDDPAEIEAAVRAASGSLSHPTGTCRMGPDGGSVVGLDLRVRGVEGLRVADNSIIPGPLNACTHAPAIMIGEKASDLVLGKEPAHA